MFSNKFKDTEIGNIPEDWQVKKLKNISKNYDSKRVPLSTRERLNIKGIYPYYGAQGIIDWINDYIYDGEFLLIAEDGANLLTRKQKITYLVKGKFWVNNHAHVIKNNDKSVLKFLYYALNMFDITPYITGSVQPKLSQNNLEKILLPNPSLSEQKSIAKILSDLDLKIKINNQTNETLEAIGQALFKHWFIDFEFPDEDGNPYKSSGGEMVYSKELGKEIPKDWEVRPFSECITVNPIRKLKKGTTARKIGMADINPWQSWVENWSFDEYKSGTKFQNKDVLFARITPSLEHGKTALVNILRENEVAFGTTEFIIFSPKIIESSLFIFHLARDERVREIAINEMTGSSGRQRVPNDCFDHLMIALPPKHIIDKFHKIISPMFEKITNNVFEYLNLIKIRDSLLPKLMSGKIRVNVSEIGNKERTEEAVT